MHCASKNLIPGIDLPDKLFSYCPANNVQQIRLQIYGIDKSDKLFSFYLIFGLSSYQYCLYKTIYIETPIYLFQNATIIVSWGAQAFRVSFVRIKPDKKCITEMHLTVKDHKNIRIPEILKEF